jgi:C2 domain
MLLRHVVACAALLSVSSAACGRQDNTPAPAVSIRGARAHSRSWVLVTVLGGRVKERSWDNAVSVNVMPMLGAALGFLNPTLGALARAAAPFTPSDSTEERLPDTFVNVTLHHDAMSRDLKSSIAPNSLNPNWNYSFYARLDSLRDAGFDITVLDADGDTAAAERVGGIHVPRELLDQVADTGRLRNIDTHDDDLASLHVRLEPVPLHASAATAHYALNLADGLTTTGLRVPEGSRITVRARGQGEISRGGGGCASTPEVSPDGLVGDACRSYNLQTLQQAPHGSAFALVGMGTAIQTVSLALPTGGSCVQFDSGTSGLLAFGVNDRDTQNNHGVFEFDVRIEPPLGDSASCPTPVLSTVASISAAGIQAL